MIPNALLLTGPAQGIFLILLLSSKRKNSDADKLLMLWLGIISAQLLFYYDNLSGLPVISDYIQLLCFSLPLASSPILFLYTQSLSFGNNFKWKNLWFHGLFYLFFNIALFYLNLTIPGAVVIHNVFPNFNNEVPKTAAYFLMTLMAIVPGFYAILSLIVLLKHQKRLPNNYSNTEKLNLNWLKSIVISLLFLFILLFLLIKYGVNYTFVTSQNLFAVVGCILSFYIFFIGYFGLRQTTIFVDIPTATPFEKVPESKALYKNSGLSNELAEKMFDQLKTHMQENKPYLDENLTLNMLAVQLNFSGNQLSQIINQKAETNFFTFINTYRVNAVKYKLKDPSFSHYSILSIGYDCGFQSKSSFNKIFKQIAGKTPSQYQND
ncbi:helix-turn-helix domain-containing protein [Pedobacter nototheniae]|uniref:helix-turn-helix domain-containing protein n=1 Tax=Pedobacter nototheniae TaxID=2488994 RepID=UPI00103FC239|nr:AraC family transcriptional regulator [Pedobacter nototheniae]